MPTWKEVTAANPQHSHNYAQRWKMMQSQGKDIDGEARLIDAMVPRGAKILDAGCGTGRVGGELAARGHEVVGVDIDPILIEHAQHDFPESTWVVGDLSTDPIPHGGFDIAVSAGNVMGFLDPAGREPALRHIFESLRPGGRFVVGYGAGRGWAFTDFLKLAAKVGFDQQFLSSAWDIQPFAEDSGFLVAVLAKPE
ncbi:methyltransferase domain-containing protein [Corynebacterium incognita]|uniref:Methyltransferase domain-containing protein n=1 Tax=Corynebacterium incognita TaxID=2754725 RepID=A0A7G7CPM6_9CORY|nr:class I SAM-dependent methyltransferase [Corynebacterium incognita]QNE89542.1 methyltransferase domain-containing protein [Corynebacterium incognita]